jgi:hypothetical protein
VRGPRLGAGWGGGGGGIPAALRVEDPPGSPPGAAGRTASGASCLTALGPARWLVAVCPGDRRTARHPGACPDGQGGSPAGQSAAQWPQLLRGRATFIPTWREGAVSPAPRSRTDRTHPAPRPRRPSRPARGDKQPARAAVPLLIASASAGLRLAGPRRQPYSRRSPSAPHRPVLAPPPPGPMARRGAPWRSALCALLAAAAAASLAPRAHAVGYIPGTINLPPGNLCTEDTPLVVTTTVSERIVRRYPQSLVQECELFDPDNDPNADTGLATVDTTPVAAPARGALKLSADGAWEYTPGARRAQGQLPRRAEGVGPTGGGRRPAPAAPARWGWVARRPSPVGHHPPTHPPPPPLTTTLLPRRPPPIPRVHPRHGQLVWGCGVQVQSA